MVDKNSNSTIFDLESYFPGEREKMRFDLLSEIALVLDDASNEQTQSAQASNLDLQMNNLVPMNPVQENHVITAGFLKRVQREVGHTATGCTRRRITVLAETDWSRLELSV